MFIILIAIIISAFILLALWRLDLAVVAVIGLLPIYLIRFGLGGIPFTLLEVFIIVLVAVFFFRYRLYRLSYLKRAIDKVPFKLATLIFFAAATLAVLVSPDIRAALGEWRAYFVEALAFYIIFVNVIKTRRQVRLLLYALGLSALVVSIYSIIQHFTGFGIPDPWGGAELRRVTAWYGYPVSVALLLAPVVGLFFGLLVWAKKSKVATHWLFSLAVVVAATLAVYYTHSRGALVAVLFAILVLSFFTRYRWWLIGLIVLAVILLAIIPGVSDRFLDVFQGEDNSTNVRLVMWQGTWRLIMDNWLFGAGLAGFPAYYDVYREAQHTELLLYPHNIILNFWIELGLVGLIAFVWLVVAFFRKALAAYRQGVDRALVGGTLAAMIVLLVHGLIDVPYFKNDLAILFWTIIGLLTIGFSLKAVTKVNKKIVQE
ncbi:O-antigen ligase family protein [Patescibacteria group bacterium]